MQALLRCALVAVICGVMGSWVVIQGRAFLGEATGGMGCSRSWPLRRLPGFRP
ncbi:hypothetical protein [Pseudarthrobacter oxydans]|uniref:hypothetical protein n=1 Tax=Pseudarthrobacter oxydans TaxID=1671 RepID=UPI003D29A1E8